MNIHTAADAVPSLDGSELGGVLEDLAGFHPGIDLIRDGLRLIALDRLTVSQTQTLIAVLAGGSDGLNLVAAIGQTIARLADPDSNPALRSLPNDRQKTAQHAGSIAAYALTDPDLHQTAAETSAAIDGI
jgi:hypothetical protein